MNRIDEVVLDVVAVPLDVGVLEALDRMDDRLLHLRSHRRVDPLEVDLVALPPLRLEEDLVTRAAGELDDLRLERRAVAGSLPAHQSGVDGAPFQVLLDNPVGLLIRVGHEDREVVREHARLVPERERKWLIACRLPFEPIDVDGPFANAWRRPCLQAFEGVAETLERAGESDRRRLAGPPGRVAGVTQQDAPAEERPGGDDHRPGRQLGVTPDANPGDPVTANDEFFDRPLDQIEAVLRLEESFPNSLVAGSVGLGAADLHRRALARVEHPDVDHRFVGGAGHRAAERVDLADELRLARPADRWIARHRSDLVERHRDQGGRSAELGGGQRRLAAGVTGSDDDDVVASHLPRRPLAASATPFPSPSAS